MNRDDIARRVVITGLGSISPLGLSAPETWEGMVQGRSGVARITLFDPSNYKTQIAAEVKNFDPKDFMDGKLARRIDRFTQFAIAASREAVADAGLDLSKEDIYRVGVLLGSGVGGIGTLLKQQSVLERRGPRRVSPFLITAMTPDAASGQVAIDLGVRGPNFAVVSACATGSGVLGEASEILRRGDADVMVAGGSEACILPITIAGFDIIGGISARNDEPEKASRPFDLDRDGFILGEGAAILVLETLEHAMKRGARIYAEFIGYGVSADAYHMIAPEPEGKGAVASMKMALRKAGIRPEDVDYINAHGTSTPLNDKSETAAIKEVFGDHAYRLMVSSTKSVTGHMLGATGATEALACAMALYEGIVPPTMNYETPDPDCDLDYVPNKARKVPIRIALSNSFGLGGHDATIILRRWEGD